MEKNPQKLEDIVDFQKDNFAKEIIEENGEHMAILFALKKGQEIPEHKSPVDAFIYILDGEVDFKINMDIEVNCDECFCNVIDADDNIFKIRKGEIFRFASDVKHSVLAKKDTKMLVVRI